MGVDAVIFDWGGTLTPWHTVDQAELWRAVCARHFPDDYVQRAAQLDAASAELWLAAEADDRSSTIDELFKLAGVVPSQALLASYCEAWEPHTFTDPAAGELLSELRSNKIKIGVLSNTMWPREWHEDCFRRDGILDLIDGAVYTSEIPWTKPHPEAFRAAMAAIDVRDPARCVFVGDRPRDDIFGAKRLGMRAVLVPHSDVPAFDGAVPDAVIGGLSELGPLIAAWSN